MLRIHPVIVRFMRICLLWLALLAGLAGIPACGDEVFNPKPDAGDATSGATDINSGTGTDAVVGSDVTPAGKPYSAEKRAEWTTKFDQDQNFDEVKLKPGVATFTPAQADEALVEPGRLLFPLVGNEALLELKPGTPMLGQPANPGRRRKAGGTNAFGFLRRVKSVRAENGQIIVETEQAQFGEVLEGAAATSMEVPFGVEEIDITGVDMEQYFPEPTDLTSVDTDTGEILQPLTIGGEFSKTFEGSFSLPKLKASLATKIGAADVKISGEVAIKAWFKFKPTLIIKVVIGWGGLDYLKLAAGAELLFGAALDYFATGEVSLTAGNQPTPKEKGDALKSAGGAPKQSKYSLAKIGPFIGPPIGPVPTVFQVRLIAECSMTVRGTVKGHSEGELGAGVLMGIEYDGDNWNPIMKGDFKRSSSNSIDASGALEAECTLGPRLEWLFAGVAGPYIGIRPALVAGIEYEAVCDQPEYIPEARRPDGLLSAYLVATLAIQMGLAIDLKVWSTEVGPYDIAKWDWNLWEWSKRFAGAGLGTDCASYCFDGQKNGYETDKDCGGITCVARCEGFKGCSTHKDCKYDWCINGSCLPDYCKDGEYTEFWPAMETDIDCGGPMCDARCGAGKTCVDNSDCSAGFCDKTTLKCKEPTCIDGLANGKESDVDCGGNCPSKCLQDKGCKQDADCGSGVCAQGRWVCAPAAACYRTGVDGLQNGAETGIDCGGPCAVLASKWLPPLTFAEQFAPEPPLAPTWQCDPGVACKVGSDCAFGTCKSGTCTTKCANGIKELDEPAVDCGGSCSKCGVGSACFGHADCNLSLCLGGICTQDVCANGTQDGTETDLDCGGTCPVGCKKDQNCNSDKDCDPAFACSETSLTCKPRCSNGQKDTAETDLDCGGICGKTCSPGNQCKANADCAGKNAICNPNGICAELGCWDGVQNFQETDTDCGGKQCKPCGVGMTCSKNKDCQSAVCTDGLCDGDPCKDGWLSPGEPGVDCGPACGKTCPLGSVCTQNSECTSGVCDGTVCVASTCVDKKLSVATGESDIDCGSACSVSCMVGQKCKNNVDCKTDVCNQKTGLCVASTCLDGKLTFGEADLDCGGSCAGKCLKGKSCTANGDCVSGACAAGVCASPDCTDGKKSPIEADVDCGTACGNTCSVGQKCKTGADCATATCSGGQCSAATCGNQQQDGDETGTDCGGSCALRCAVGQGCGSAADCQSGACNGTLCVATTCLDGQLTAGKEADTDCGGTCKSRCVNGKMCEVGSDCASNQCLDGICGVPGCSNGKLDFGEAALDCGGKSCPTKACVSGQACAVASDCQSGFCASGICSSTSCKTASQDGTETDVDCGGSCASCSQGKTCKADSDCQSKLCHAGLCASALCANGKQDPQEGGVDCGGNCAALCLIGASCSVNSDCASNLCAPPGQCAALTCANSSLDGGESDLDCGGACGGNCALGQTCASAADCLSGRCDLVEDICTDSTCFDGKWTPGETSVDCGGACPMQCQIGEGCQEDADCNSGFCNGQLCVASACADNKKTGSETGVDCGGPCQTKCALNKGCLLAADCESGFCNGTVCVASACADKQKSGAETGVDCGGDCGPCPMGGGCASGDDCGSGICNGTVCVTSTCLDKQKSAGEADIDCGGPCKALCLSGKTCAGGSDCISGVCSLSGKCAINQCLDERKNGGESDIDCGSVCGNNCSVGAQCGEPADCASGACHLDGTCAASQCSDGKLNGSESATDCGGSCGSTCEVGIACGSGADCVTAVCGATGQCASSACDDGFQNGGEGDVDCGGGCAKKCALTSKCGSDADCASSVCGATSKVCVATTCVDQEKGEDESDVDCGGSCVADCAFGQLCNGQNDCAAGECLDGQCGCKPGYELSGTVCVNVNECTTAGASADQVQSALVTRDTADGLAFTSAEQAQAAADAVALALVNRDAAADACSAEPTPECDAEVALLGVALADAQTAADAAATTANEAADALVAAEAAYQAALTASQTTLAGCSVNAACADLPGSVTCTCNTGYAGDGKTCNDVDECKDGSAGCDPHADCLNSTGSFACTCQEGWDGNGTSCMDVDECLPGAQVVCGTNTVCDNALGSFACSCAEGFEDCDGEDNNGCEVNLLEDKANCGECFTACDNDVCTVGDQCDVGVCLPGTATVCDDDNACTTDTCDPIDGCQFDAVADNSPCTDGNACTDNDTCQVGACSSGTVNTCNDNNSCTTDSCDASTGCSNLANPGATCDDGNACTQGEVCSGSSCEGGSAVDCSDDNLCTTEACVPATGCKTVFLTSGDFCGNSGRCDAGECVAPKLVQVRHMSKQNGCQLDHDANGASKGTVSCWGEGDFIERLFGVTSLASAQPVPLPANKKAVLFSQSATTLCVVMEDDTVWCAGGNHIAGYATTPVPYPAALNQIQGLTGKPELVRVGELGAAVVIAGKIYAWGDKREFNANSETLSATAAEIPSLTEVVDIHLGNRSKPILDDMSGTYYFNWDNSCLLAKDGTVRCWWPLSGGKAWPPATRNTGTDKPLLLVDGNDFGVCGILPGGKPKCWGTQLTTAIADPAIANNALDVWTPMTFNTPAAGAIASTCARLASGAVYCGGGNRFGGLANGERDEQSSTGYTFAKVNLPGDAISLTARDGTSLCAMLKDGKTYCWGSRGDLGTLGDGMAIDKSKALPVPTLVANSTPDLLYGANATNAPVCRLDVNQVPTCAGLANYLGQSRNGISYTGFVRTPTGFAGGMVSLAGVDAETCGVALDGKGHCWTYGGNPVEQSVGSAATAVALSGWYDGGYTSARCYIVTGGAIRCAGSNKYGSLGQGDLTARAGHHEPLGLNSNYTKIQASSDFGAFCALRDDGKIYCWGNNFFGMMGSGSVGGSGSIVAAYPAPVSGISTALDIASGGTTFCAALGNGTVQCWGNGSVGTLGNNTTANTGTPVTVQEKSGSSPQTLTGVTDVAMATFVGCGLRSDGVWCWGNNNSNGQSGAPATSRPYADLVPGTAGATKLTSGPRGVCALLATGIWSCWGNSGIRNEGYAPGPALVVQP
jgi:hypothetical protein